eukprot:CAMPEP_0175992790 /NCGR_PEP_ID=MMETSP0108-20121206/53610_1 /TAXON_ID=195067 ORGANISM="Goniomonas pacifica, Strain CCMP1869" /NCGR_SAMPLE_ID=MMETSP0108 /ASSEMBLY_ACC=CAM_ASM_000204 /LENGTH=86 /DNA_ID=CAMNT_0017324517 /DNA_START=200 /DNA_END=460 /DNA_ORIENTATION=-
MAHDQVIDLFRIDLLLQKRQPGVAEFGVTGINQGGAFTPHQKGVVGGAVAQAKFNIETASLPVEGANRAAVSSNHFRLKGEPRTGA